MRWRSIRLRRNDQSLFRTIVAFTAFLVGPLFVSFDRGHAEDGVVQSPEKYEKAIHHSLDRERAETELARLSFEKAIRIQSTHTYVVFVTIVNDNTGEKHSACIAARLLLGAIHKEYDLKYDASSMEKVIQIALANPSREFHFSKQAAIDNMPLPGKEKGGHLEDQRQYQRRLQQACALVREGNLVFLADITGQVSIDRTR
jgi:hypothetical protein